MSMSEIYDADLDGDGDLDKIAYEEHPDGTATALVDLNADGRPDVALYDANGDGHADYIAYDANGDGQTDYAGPLHGVVGHESGHEAPSAPAPGHADPGYTGSAGYTEPGYAEAGYTEPGYAEAGYTEPGYAEPGYTEPSYAADGGNFYANSNIDTAVSSNADGSAGYIATGDGEFYSWS
jgi:hypothetical protein